MPTLKDKHYRKPTLVDIRKVGPDVLHGPEVLHASVLLFHKLVETDSACEQGLGIGCWCCGYVCMCVCMCVKHTNAALLRPLAIVVYRKKARAGLHVPS
jgi:hypothetical protein